MFKSLIATAALILTTGPIASAQIVPAEAIIVLYSQGRVTIDCQRGLYQVEGGRVKRFEKYSPAEILCQVAAIPVPSQGTQI